MKTRRVPFNIIFLSLAVLLVACETTEEKKHSKEASTMRLFLETSEGDNGHGVPVLRSNPVRVSVEREPFLTEADMDKASVVDEPGGFGISVQFNGHGALVLEQVTVAHRGQRIVVQSTFGETRWLAAPVIKNRIANGELVFTPDATRDEAERIVRGLNNVITKIKKKANSFWGS